MSSGRQPTDPLVFIKGNICLPAYFILVYCPCVISCWTLYCCLNLSFLYPTLSSENSRQGCICNNFIASLHSCCYVFYFFLLLLFLASIFSLFLPSNDDYRSKTKTSIHSFNEDTLSLSSHHFPLFFAIFTVGYFAVSLTLFSLRLDSTLVVR